MKGVERCITSHVGRSWSEWSEGRGPLYLIRQLAGNLKLDKEPPETTNIGPLKG